MSNNLSVWHKLLLLVLIPLTFELVFVLSLGALLKYAQEESDRYEQSKNILLHFHMAESTLLHSMATALGSAQDIQLFLANLDANSQQFLQTSKEIKQSAAIRPELKESLNEVPEIFDEAVALAHRARAIVKPDGSADLNKLVLVRNQGISLAIQFQQISGNVLRAESRMSTVAPEQLSKIRLGVVTALVLGILVSIGLTAVAAYLFVNHILLRLKKIENNARLLGIRAPLSNLPTGRDELGVLANSLLEADRVLVETRRKELVILDAAADVICSLDHRCRFTAIGASSFPSWGYPASDLLGKSLLSLQTSDSESSCRTALESIEQTGGEGEFESKLLCKSVGIKDILWKVSWSQENNNFYCVAHDISERRAADRMKQRFIAIASHDLRTPLSSISATLSLLNRGARGLLTQEAKKILGKAESSLERLMDLIRDLLDLEKLEAGKVVMDLSCVSALDVCLAACESVEFLAKSLDVSIVMPHGDVSILGDERRLVRVLINLLSNAIKFSKRGSTVTMTLKDLGDQTEISVFDKGPGIAEADRDLIFEKFRQTKTSTTTALKGTGLGLAIAKFIVQGHNGKIGCESKEGNGSRFFVLIPNFMDKENDE